MRYTKAEGLASSFLSRFPRLKPIIKRLYQYANWLVFRSSRRLVTETNWVAVGPQNDVTEADRFFGYYDEWVESPNRKLFVYHEVAGSTSFEPEHFDSVDICICDTDGVVRNRFSTRAFNWQQGAKVKWVNNQQLIYNDYDVASDTYVSKVFDLRSERSVVLGRAAYDAFDDQYYLALNFKRLATLRPDYGYFAHKADCDLADLMNDGIWFCGFGKEESNLLVSLQTLVNLDYRESMKNCRHKVNHICISPNGARFIFLHRWITGGGRRFDRLLLMNRDGSGLRILADFDMVSHCCWYGSEAVVAYMNYSGDGVGFYLIDLSDFSVQRLPASLSISGDGHPAVFKDTMVFDSYPDRSGMKSLYVYDFKSGQLKNIGGFYEPIRYVGQTRCDLHPRWSRDGNFIYVDSTHSGSRQLLRLELPK